MKTMRWLVCCFAATLLVAAFAEAGEREEGEERDRPKADTLVFQGKGRSRNRDEDTAFEEAVVAAKEDAFEKAIERLLHDMKDPAFKKVATRYAKEKLTPDKCIEKKVVDKRRTESTTYVTVKATFNDELPKAIAVVKQKFEQLGYPKLMVVINEEIIQPANLPPIPPGGLMAQIAVEQVLIKKRFRIVDKATIDGNTRKRAQSCLLEGKNDELAKLAREHGADVFVGGQPARAQYLGAVDVAGVGAWPRYAATIDIRAVDTDTARVLVSQACEGRGVGEAPLLAVRNAFNDAGKKMAKKVLDDILYFWIVVERMKTITVMLKAVEHGKALEVADALVEEEKKWIRRHGPVTMQAGDCSFDLTIEGTKTASNVADTIKQMEKKLKVTEVKERRVVLQKAEE